MENINRTILSFGKQYQGIIKMVGAVLAFLLTLGTLINLINISGFVGLSLYPGFSEILYTFSQIMAIICAVAGFCMLGIMLLIKPQHILVPIALGILACSSLFGAAEDFFYYIWQTANYHSFYFNYPYLFMAFLALLTAVAWAFPAVAGFTKNKAMFRNMALILLIIPAALFLIYFFAGIFTGVLYFSSFLYSLLKYALMVTAALVVLCADEKPAMESIREMNEKNAEQRWQDAQRTQPGQTTHAAYDQSQSNRTQNNAEQPQRPMAGPEPDGYIGIVKLIILSIVTFGIYIYIWIYKTTKYLDYTLNRQGSFSPGVEVVLCLFVPFYFIYWIYKQTKAADEAHKIRGNFGNDDLAIINLLLVIFGLSIVANALLQDQINKLCMGYTAPPNYERPQNPQQNTTYSYNFDPQTGQPVNDAPAEAPQETETPAEIFTEVPIKESSEEETTTSSYEEAPADETELPAEEPPAKEADASDPQAVAAQLENVKMLKQLLDAGVLTQEEFDAKKKDILGL